MESRFETVRTRLEQQYQPMLTEPESGPDQETLKQELEKYETLHQNEPLIRLKAEMLALILTRGRIGIDPFDHPRQNRYRSLRPLRRPYRGERAPLGPQ